MLLLFLSLLPLVVAFVLLLFFSSIFNVALDVFVAVVYIAVVGCFFVVVVVVVVVVCVDLMAVVAA